MNHNNNRDMHITKSQWRSPRVGLNLATAFVIGATLVSSQAQTSGEAQAQTTTPATNAPVEPKYPWETTAAFGLTLTRGNSKTLLLTLSLESKRKWDHNEVLFGVAGGYGEDHDVKNTEFINAYGQYNRLFTERFYAGIRLDGTYDGIANLDYRVRITPLAGYYLIKNPKTSLSVEVGPSVVFEKYKNESEDTYLGLRIGERLEHKLTATTKIWESLDYVPRVDDWANKYVITGEAGIDTAINKHWSLRVVFQDIYDSSPAAGRENNDLRLVAGTAYKF
jgi:putative salt-induced outer membrane protein YdiY